MVGRFKNILFILFGLVVFVPGHCFAQDSFFGLFKSQGELISEGSSSSPAGDLRVTTYRLETVPLQVPFELERGSAPLERVFRLTVQTFDALPMETFSIWIDGGELSATQVGPKSVSVLIYSRTLPNGVSLGLSVRGRVSLESRSILSETLCVPPEFATPREQMEVEIIIRRVPGSRAGMIALEIKNTGLETCAHLNSICDLYIVIDGQQLSTLNYLTPERYSSLRDGAEIVLKRGRNLREAQTVRVLGRLDKSSLR
jgi:hypothetical protein